MDKPRPAYPLLPVLRFPASSSRAAIEGNRIIASISASGRDVETLLYEACAFITGGSGMRKLKADSFLQGLGV